MVASRAGLPSASTSRSSARAEPPPAISSARSASRSWRRPSGSSPPNGPSSSSLASAAVSGARSIPTSTSVSRARAVGSSRSATPPVAAVHGHLGVGERAAHHVELAAAAHDDRQVAPRHAVHEVPLAQLPGDRGPLARRRLAPRCWPRAHRRRASTPAPDRRARRAARWVPAAAAPIRSVTTRVTWRSASPCRCAVPRVNEPGAGQLQHLGEAAERVGLRAAERVGRDIRVAERDHADAAARERPQDRERRLRRLLEVVDHDEPQAPRPGRPDARCGSPPTRTARARPGRAAARATP